MQSYSCGTIYLYVTYMSSTLLTATEFARVCQVTPRTVRWYQEKGLLIPVKVDEWSKYAYFSPEQALTVFRIKLLQQSQLTLSEIKASLGKKSLLLDEEIKQFRNFILEKQKELAVLEEMNRIVNGDITERVKREEVGPFSLFTHKISQGDYYKIDTYIEELKKTAMSLGIEYEEKVLTFYYDRGYNPKGADLEVSIVCKGTPETLQSLPSNHSFKEFSKTLVLAIDFNGPLQFIEFVYEKMNKYIKLRSISVENYTFELYLKDTTKISYPLSILD